MRVCWDLSRWRWLANQRLIPLQLAASRVDIQAARLAHEALHGLPYDGLEAGHPLGIGRFKRNAWPGIEGDQKQGGDEEWPDQTGCHFRSRVFLYLYRTNVS